MPILTSSGSGLGSGDYNGTGIEFVGSWAECEVEIVSVKPQAKDYDFIDVNFV